MSGSEYALEDAVQMIQAHAEAHPECDRAMTYVLNRLRSMQDDWK